MSTTDRVTHCPHCGRLNDAHEGAPGTEPKPGDVGICWVCGGLGVFTEEDMRKPTPEERKEFNADPEIRRARAAMRESYLPQQAAKLTWPGTTP